MKRHGTGLALLLAACGGAGETDRPAARDTATPPPAAAVEWQSCTHEEGGYSVQYPSDWRTNDGAIMPVCSLFDPAPMTVPEASEIPEDIAVVVSVEPVAYDDVVASTFGIRILSQEDVRVAGRRGTRRLVEHTGDGLYDRGLRTWEYLVDWGNDRTLIASSNDAGEPAFEEKRRVLDAMMERLQAR